LDNLPEPEQLAREAIAEIRGAIAGLKTALELLKSAKPKSEDGKAAGEVICPSCGGEVVFTIRTLRIRRGKGAILVPVRRGRCTKCRKKLKDAASEAHGIQLHEPRSRF
jgi:DNA-directed RNA polymerase subunit RPC12/RpoP